MPRLAALAASARAHPHGLRHLLSTTIGLANVPPATSLHVVA
jgi:hypothetical protein